MARSKAEVKAQHSNNTKVAQLHRDIASIETNIESMRAGYRRMGERTDWEDPRLDSLYDDICRLEDHVAKLRRRVRRLERIATTPRPPRTAA